MTGDGVVQRHWWQTWPAMGASLALVAAMLIGGYATMTASIMATSLSGQCAAVAVDANGVGQGGAGYQVASFNIKGAGHSAASAGMAGHKADYAWSRRGPEVVRYVSAINPDLIGFQENGLLPGTNRRQIGTVQKAMVGYQWLYTDKPIPIAWRASAFTLKDHGRIHLSTIGVAGATTDRWAVWALLKATSDGSELLYINLHAQHMNLKGPAKARSVGWTHLVNALKTINPDNRVPMIMTGDFNARNDETRPVFQDHLVKLGAAGFVEAAATGTTIEPVARATSYNGWGDTIGGRWYYKAINRAQVSNHIDYVWTAGQARATTWQIYTGPSPTWKTIKGQQVPFASLMPSDHWPVIAKVLVGAGTPDQTSADAGDDPQLALQQQAGTSGGFGLPAYGQPRNQSLRTPAGPIPAPIKALYGAAAARYRLPWQLLAGIGMAETRHGANNATSSAGAQGLMQFMPATFAAYGVDGDGDGRTDIHSDADSVFAAANYLVASGARKGPDGVLDALWAYNHSTSYRNDVLFFAWSYLRDGGADMGGSTSGCSGAGQSLSTTATGVWADVISFALSKVGVYPYSWGGGGLDGPSYGTGDGAGISGFDCSSFVRFVVYQKTGVVLPRDSRSQAQYFQSRGVLTRTNDRLQLQAGDVVFFARGSTLGSIYHVAIVTKPGWIVEEPGNGRYVQHNPMERRMPGDIWGYARVDLTALKTTVN